jgi:hypothetical protein
MIETARKKTRAAVPAGNETLEGCLVVPTSPDGVVVVAHAGPGSGCSTCRLWLVEQLNRARLATCLVDLDAVAGAIEPTPGLPLTRSAMLAKRLSAVIQWVTRESAARDVPLGCFVEGEVSGPGLACAAAMPGLVAAIVSLCGRPGAVRSGLSEVRSPTLFIASEGDSVPLAETKEAFRRLRCPKRLEVIPTSNSRFAALGATEHVPELASAWFAAFLRQRSVCPDSVRAVQRQE